MNAKRHQDKVALVTGGAQGIGAGIVKVLVERGARVAIVDKNAETAAAYAATLSNSDQHVVSIQADISTEEGCRSAVNDVIASFGALDMLVNNAAPGRNKAHIGRLDGPDWQAHAEVVLQGAARLAEASLPHLRKASMPAIVNISSVTAAAVAPEQCSWPYHVSKAGLEQMTRYLASQFGGDNIRVNAVAPGLVDREGGMKISDNPENRKIIEAIVPLKRAATAEEIGAIVSFLCSEDASYITGQVLVADGGMGIRENFGASLLARQAD